MKGKDKKPTDGSVSKNASDQTKKDKETSSSSKASANGAATKVDKSKNTNSEKIAHVRGEAQKPVTESYRKNWNAIFKR